MADEVIIGIDLGTTFSLVAHLDAQGRPVTIPNAEGDLLTPSVVFLDPAGAVVGKEALKAAEFDPARVAAFPKRDMGHNFFSRPVRGESLRPEVLQALVLRKLKADAELKLGPVSKCVITVPAYFNEPRRKATQDAGRMAGLEVLDILNEPTAAAIACGVQRGFLSTKHANEDRETILVYDLGGGTFDATLMKVEASTFTTLATAGDVELGGIDWDQRIVNHLGATFLAEHGVDPREDPAAALRLRAEAESAKRSLSTRPDVAVAFAHDGKRVRVPLSRQLFESLTGDLLDRTSMTLRKLLRDAGSSFAEVTRVLTVGGSTRMPMVLSMLERESGRPADRSMSPDEAVAHGAALYAGHLRDKRFRVRNVNSHALGVLGIDRETGTKRRQIMIPRNSPLPARSTQKFATFKADQRSAAVHVVEGGDASGNHSTHIGKCVIDGLPNSLPKNTPIEVTYRYTEAGRLEVRASVPSAEVEAKLTIERASGMPEGLLQSWFECVAAGMPDGYDRPEADTQPEPVIEVADDIEEVASDALSDDNPFGDMGSPWK